MAERLDRNRTAIVTALFVAVLTLGALTQFLPRLTQSGDVVTSTPVRQDLAAVQAIVLHPGERACLSQVTLDRAAGVARVGLAPNALGAAPTKLALAASAPGYRAAATISVARGQGGQLQIPFAPPRRTAIGALCLRNGGRRTVALAGTADPRALTRSKMTLDGAPRNDAFSLTLLAAGQRTLLDRFAQLVARTAALSAVGPWMLWLLLPLLLLGVPVLVLAALRAAVHQPDATDPDAQRATTQSSTAPIDSPLRNTRGSRTFRPPDP
jgi:hypothetical protein